MSRGSDPFAFAEKASMVIERVTAVLCIGALPVCVAAQESVESWPAKPVTMIVPLSPGAAVDIETRLYAQKLAQNTGRSFVVDYKPGAGTTIGMAHVAKSPPDGHTLGMISASATIATLAYPNLAFDPQKDLALITLMTYRPTLLLVKASTPLRSVKELVAYARAHPGKVNAGTSGAGSLGELSWASFARTAGIRLTLVHYKGGAPANIALVSGEIDMIWGGFASSMGYIKAGKVRVLGISTLEPPTAAPRRPHGGGAGRARLHYLQWIGVGVPAATPSAIIAKLNVELVKVAKDPDVLQRLSDDGTVAVGSSPERFRAIFQEDVARWRKVAAETGVKFTR